MAGRIHKVIALAVALAAGIATGAGEGTTPGHGSPAGMPAGHPTTGAAQKPTSHGGAGGMMKRPDSGAVRDLVSQGTKGGPSIGAEPATVELFAKGQVLKRYETAFNEKGELELAGLPLDVAFQPVITVRHAGSEQQLVGAVVNVFQPAIELEMKVYEPTEERPAWTIGMRRVEAALERVGGVPGLRVVELIGVHNPLDRAWLGEKQADGTRRTLAVKLPAGAMDVQFGPGMAEAGATVEKGVAVRGKTLLPGAHEHVLGYFVPSVEGRALLRYAAPADTSLMAVYLPGGVTVVRAEGVEAAKPGGTHAGAKSQLLASKKREVTRDGKTAQEREVIKAGTDVVIELAGIDEAVKAAEAAKAAQATTRPADGASQGGWRK